MASKTLEEYLDLAYTVEVIHNEDGFFARVAELPGCMTWTDTIEALWPMVEDAKRAWIEDALEHGDTVPEPLDPSPELVLLRLPDELHTQVKQQARREGLPMDRFLASTIARAVGE